MTEEAICFIKANLKECCSELMEYQNTGILPIGKIWEAMGLSEDGLVAPVFNAVRDLAVASFSEYENEGVFLDFPVIKVPKISVHVQDDTVIILHDKKNSLFMFTLPTPVETDKIAEVVNQELAGLDWDKDFDYVFTHQTYRKAVMEIASKLF